MTPPSRAAPRRVRCSQVLPMHESLKKLFSRSNTTSSAHYVVVGVGSEIFGVPATQIHEIICLGDLETMPKLPKSLSGPIRIFSKLVCLVKLQIPFLRTTSEFELTA